MIIQMVETIQITNHDGISHWFIEPQQYAYTSTSRGKDGYIRYTVTLDDIEYDIPEYVIALLPGETPSADMRSISQRMEDYVMRDPSEELLGTKDVVKAAQEFLGVDISAKQSMDQVDYDQVALRSIHHFPGNIPITPEGDTETGINQKEQNDNNKIESAEE